MEKRVQGAEVKTDYLDDVCKNFPIYQYVIHIDKQTALVGLAESGNYGKRSIFAGKAKLCKALYMAAVTSLRCNPKGNHLIA